MAPSTNTSSLSYDSDFASELVLNRIMNGQLEPASKKTVTAANRALASDFDATGYSYGVIAENIAVGKTVVEGSQNALTEVMDQVKRLGEICSALDDPGEAQRSAREVWQNIAAIMKTEVGLPNLQGSRVHVFHDASSGPLNVTIGEGSNDVLPVGDIDLDALAGFNALHTAVNNGTISSANAMSLCEDAVEDLLGAIANQGAKSQILSNRYDMLNDLISTYHEASDDSSKVIGPSALFNTVM